MIMLAQELRTHSLFEELILCILGVSKHQHSYSTFHRETVNALKREILPGLLWCNGNLSHVSPHWQPGEKVEKVERENIIFVLSPENACIVVNQRIWRIRNEHATIHWTNWQEPKVIQFSFKDPGPPICSFLTSADSCCSYFLMLIKREWWACEDFTCPLHHAGSGSEAS